MNVNSTTAVNIFILCFLLSPGLYPLSALPVCMYVCMGFSMVYIQTTQGFQIHADVYACKAGKGRPVHICSTPLR